MHGKCEHCNEYNNLTTHHVKNRVGEQVAYIECNTLKYIIEMICRPCHDIIETDYILTNRVWPMTDVYDQITRLINGGTNPKMKEITYMSNALLRRGRRNRDCSTELYLLKGLYKLVNN